jgi:hypothetical protein
MVRNVHERRLRGRPEDVGELLDGLAGPDDRLWPAPAWPPLRLDRPLGVGAVGGHGPIRYVVEAYDPGRMVRFRFAPSLGAHGSHAFVVLTDGDDSVLRHELDARTSGRMRLAWPLAVRWLHDALIEDLLDRAEAAVDGAGARRTRWSPWVRILRAAASLRPPRRAPHPVATAAAERQGVARSAFRGHGGRRLLQVVLGALACIPLASGLAGVLVGPSSLPRDTSEVGASLDSEYRFTNVYWLALAPVIWSTVPRVEQSTGVLRAALGTTFVAGLARLLAWRRSGAPHPALVAALGLELIGAPVLLAWQRHVARVCGQDIATPLERGGE